MALKDKKIIGAPFSNVGEIIRVKYDFSDDAGAVGDYDVLEADGACIVEYMYMKVVTEVDSSGNACVLDLGKGDGGTEYHSDLAESSLGVDAINTPIAEDRFLELTDGEKIVLGIEGEAATAGMFEMVFKIYKK
jgi:hypothetical protein